MKNEFSLKFEVQTEYVRVFPAFFAAPTDEQLGCLRNLEDWICGVRHRLATGTGHVVQQPQERNSGECGARENVVGP